MLSQKQVAATQLLYMLDKVVNDPKEDKEVQRLIKAMDPKGKANPKDIDAVCALAKKSMPKIERLQNTAKLLGMVQEFVIHSGDTKDVLDVHFLVGAFNSYPQEEDYRKVESLYKKYIMKASRGELFKK